ncbi:MAG: VWA domain-containing protein [Alphaproteobacteria bacterium]|nr:VWA domain-containing protein [Alphaproteobacteria bacterium]
MDFTFVWPFAVLIAFLPFLIRYFSKPLDQQATQNALCVPFFDVFKAQIGSYKISFSNSFKFFFIAGFLALVVALMRPVLYEQASYIPLSGRQLMLVLDVSGSMGERDFVLNGKRVSRLQALKSIASDFMQERKGDMIGMTVFGKQAYLYTPITPDIQTAQEMLSELELSIVDGSYTAIGDGLLLALKQMKDIPADKKVIVLLSDGFANAGVDPRQVLQLAKQMNTKVYTIGMASEKHRQMDDFFFAPFNLQPDLDENLLQQIATQTNGQYFRVKTTEDLKKVYDELNKIEPVQTDMQLLRQTKELFWIPLLISMLLFFVGVYLRQVRQ